MKGNYNKTMTYMLLCDELSAAIVSVIPKGSGIFPQYGLQTDLMLG